MEQSRETSVLFDFQGHTTHSFPSRARSFDDNGKRILYNMFSPSGGTNGGTSLLEMLQKRHLFF